MAVRGWAACWPHNVHFMSLTRAMEPCCCWRQLSLVTDRMGQLHSVYSAGHHKPVPRLVTAGRCHWPEMRGPSETGHWRSWTKHKEGSWMKVIREEAKSGSTRILHYWSWCLLSIIKVVNCRIGNVSQANLQLPRDTITGSLTQLPLDNIGHYKLDILKW